MSEIQNKDINETQPEKKIERRGRPRKYTDKEAREVVLQRNREYNEKYKERRKKGELKRRIIKMRERLTGLEEQYTQVYEEEI